MAAACSWAIRVSVASSVTRPSPCFKRKSEIIAAALPSNGWPKAGAQISGKPTKTSRNKRNVPLPITNSFPCASRSQFLGSINRVKREKSLLVGAAGFEPTTCSTQNCRATRLRYTPNTREHDSTELNHAPALSFCLSTIFSENRVSTHRVMAEGMLFRIMPWETTSIHACAVTSKPPAAVSSAVKERMRHAVSGRDPVLLCRAGNHLQHPFRRPPRRDDPGR